MSHPYSRKNDRRLILLTGASSGIGFESAMHLIRAGHNIILPCRDNYTSTKLHERICTSLGEDLTIRNNVLIPIMNLEDLKSISIFTNQLLNQVDRLDSLVLNAGLQYTGERISRRSIQDYELTFAVNHLANQLITHKLLPLLIASGDPRIIITSSEVHNPKTPGGSFGLPAGLGSLNGIKAGKSFEMIDGSNKFNADKAYKDSKLCNILFARELSRRITQINKQMPVIAWAPGLVIPRTNTGFFRYSRINNEIGQRIFSFLARDLFRVTESVEKAGFLLSKLATDLEYSNIGFNYYSNKLIGYGSHKLQLDTVSSEASSNFLAEELWILSDALINDFK